MEFNVDTNRIRQDTACFELVKILESPQISPFLDDASFYFDFPIIKDYEDDNVVIAKSFIVSKMYGIIIISIVQDAIKSLIIANVKKSDKELENLYSSIYARLLRNRKLRKNKTTLLFSIDNLIYTQNSQESDEIFDVDSEIIKTQKQFFEYFSRKEKSNIDDATYKELISTIDGTRNLIISKERDIVSLPDSSKGSIVNKVETNIGQLDRGQREGSMTVLDGFQRIRGLAGSGKTIVLAMKAALTHLRDPNAIIVYTYYTKSLHQHIKNLITKFYRQYEDSDPDWTKLWIMHGWGGHVAGEGVYTNACYTHNINAINYSEARIKDKSDPFRYVCNELLRYTNLNKIYDYTFIDEGQDFPSEFVKLCIKLTKNDRVVFASDELQTIFRTTTPEIKDIVGVKPDGRLEVELTQDVVLNVCYRNPKEILICAHALGFGIYDNVPAQMLEKREQWIDLGYEIEKGDFTAGSETIIIRPDINSPLIISKLQEPKEIVKANSFEAFSEEVQYVAKSISEDIKDGLRPDDIMVISVDDRNAKIYLNEIEENLNIKYKIRTNNNHNLNFAVTNFIKENCVTLSTVHKAKGNEAYMVYIVGIDSVFHISEVRDRNMIFTAMTRAKCWVRLSGIGTTAKKCCDEINKAIENCPRLKFSYPTDPQWHVIKQDHDKRMRKRQFIENRIDEVLVEYSPDEAIEIIRQRSSKKGM